MYKGSRVISAGPSIGNLVEISSSNVTASSSAPAQANTLASWLAAKRRVLWRSGGNIANAARASVMAHDVRAAVQFLRSQGAKMKVDAERIGLIGDSTGAYLAALVALAGDKPPFVGTYKNDPYSNVSTKVKV